MPSVRDKPITAFHVFPSFLDKDISPVIIAPINDAIAANNKIIGLLSSSESEKP